MEDEVRFAGTQSATLGWIVFQGPGWVFMTSPALLVGPNSPTAVALAELLALCTAMWIYWAAFLLYLWRSAAATSYVIGPRHLQVWRRGKLLTSIPVDDVARIETGALRPLAWDVLPGGWYFSPWRRRIRVVMNNGDKVRFPALANEEELCGDAFGDQIAAASGRPVRPITPWW